MTAQQVRKVYPHLIISDLIAGREARKLERRTARMNITQDRRRADRREQTQ